MPITYNNLSYEAENPNEMSLEAPVKIVNGL